jgi:hypothetical protein
MVARKGEIPMRPALALFVFAALVSPLAYSQTATPAAQPTKVACEGSLNTVRVSEIKPGMMGTFMEAVAAHQAWYKNAGGPDQIVAMRVIDQAPGTKAQSYSETEVVTSHVEPVTRAQPLPPHDASYDAFVKLYKESSTIKSQYDTCMPNR